MSGNHFEDLWEDAENLTRNVYKEKSNEDLISEITSLLNNYKDIDLSKHVDEIKSSVKNRYMGEIVFILSALSLRDNINVYAALKEEVILNTD